MSEETGFLIAYLCPFCKHEWREEWSCACDSDCPECGARHITALAYVETEGEDTPDDPEVALDMEVTEIKERGY